MYASREMHTTCGPDRSRCRVHTRSEHEGLAQLNASVSCKQCWCVVPRGGGSDLSLGTAPERAERPDHVYFKTRTLQIRTALTGRSQVDAYNQWT